MADVADAGANGARKLFTRCCSSISPSLFYLLGLVGAVGIALFTALILMFLIHQLTIWVSQDPVRAFHAAQTGVQVFAAGWDVGMAAYNSLREIVILLLPLWNGMAMYVAQPAIFVVIEVMVLTFSDKAYTGVLSEDTLPFEGHNCVAEGTEITAANEATAQFCGNAELYAKAIGTTRGANSIEGNATLVMSTETARRLSEASADTILAQIGLAPLLDGVQALAAALLTVTATVSDIFWHVAYEVLSVAFKLVFQAFLLLVRSLGAAFTAIFSDGTFMEILGWGIEFLMIFVMEWLLPSVFNVINALMCILDLFQPDGWQEQLDCIEDSCYPDGSTSTAAWFPFAVIDGYQTFTSIPDIWNKVIRITERVTNKATGQAYDTTSGGRTDLPNFGDLYFPTTPKVQQCNACFACKIPEFRAIWLVVAYIFGCVFDSTTLEGVATDRCLVGGSYYTQLCGPRPAEGFECTAQSPTLALFAATYQKHRDVDGWKAERVIDRMLESMGGDQAEGASQDGEHMTAIKNAWLERAELGLDEEDWNAPLVRQVCRVMRCNHPQIDPGDLYANDHEPDTAAYHASRAVYEFCLQGEALPTCKSPVLSDFTINSYELGICLKSQPDCIRDREVCLGTCGGSETGAPMVHDVVTTMVKDDLYGVDATRLDNGRINATLQNVIVNVPMFDLSPSFRLFSARVRTRGGFTGAPPPTQEGRLSRLLLTAPSACAAQPSIRRTAHKIHLRAPWCKKVRVPATPPRAMLRYAHLCFPSHSSGARPHAHLCHR